MLKGVIQSLLVAVFILIATPSFAQSSGKIDLKSSRLDFKTDGEEWLEKLIALVPSNQEYLKTLPVAEHLLEQMTLTSLWREYLGVCTEDRLTPYPVIYKLVSDKAKSEGSVPHIKAIEILHKTVPISSVKFDNNLHLSKYLNDDDPFIAHLALSAILLQDVLGKSSSALDIYRNWSEGFDRLSLLLPPESHDFAVDSRYIHYTILGAFYAATSNIDRSYESSVSRQFYAKKLGLNITPIANLINLTQNHISRFKDARVLGIYNNIIKIEGLRPRHKLQVQTIYALQAIMFGKYEDAASLIKAIPIDSRGQGYWNNAIMQTDAAISAISGNSDKSQKILSKLDVENKYAKIGLLREISDVNNALPDSTLRVQREKITSILAERSWNIRAKNSFFQAKMLTQDRSGGRLNEALNRRSIRWDMSYSDIFVDQYFAETEKSLLQVDQQAFERIVSKTKSLDFNLEAVPLSSVLDTALLSAINRYSQTNTYENVAMLRHSLADNDQMIADILTVVENATLSESNRATENRALGLLVGFEARVESELQASILDLAHASLAIRSGAYKKAWFHLDKIAEGPSHIDRDSVLLSARLLELKLNLLARDLPEILNGVSNLLANFNFVNTDLIAQKVVAPTVMSLHSAGFYTESDQLLRTLTNAELISSGSIDNTLTFLQAKLLLSRGEVEAAIPFLKRAMYEQETSDQKLQVLLSLYTAYFIKQDAKEILVLEQEIEALVQSGGIDEKVDHFGIQSYRNQYVKSVLNGDENKKDILNSWAQFNLTNSYSDKITERQVALAKLAMLNDKAVIESTALKIDNERYSAEITTSKVINYGLLATLVSLVFTFAGSLLWGQKQAKALATERENIASFQLFHSNVFGVFHPTMNLILKQLRDLTDSVTEVSLQNSVETAYALSQGLSRRVTTIQILKNIKYGNAPETRQMVTLAKFVDTQKPEWEAMVQGVDVRVRVNLEANAGVFLSNTFLIETLIDLTLKEALKNTFHGCVDLIISRESEPYPETLLIQIKDTGNGTAPLGIPKVEGVLPSMMNRVQNSFSLSDCSDYSDFSLVPLIAEYMSGRVEITSISGNGTEVIIQIPVETAIVKGGKRDSSVRGVSVGKIHAPANQR